MTVGDRIPPHSIDVLRVTALVIALGSLMISVPEFAFSLERYGVIDLGIPPHQEFPTGWRAVEADLFAGRGGRPWVYKLLVGTVATISLLFPRRATVQIIGICLILVIIALCIGLAVLPVPKPDTMFYIDVFADPRPWLCCLAVTTVLVRDRYSHWIESKKDRVMQSAGHRE